MGGFPLALFGLATPLASCRPEAHATSSIPLSPWPLTGGSAEVVDAVCAGTLSVPEDRSPPRPGAKDRASSIAVVKASGRKAAPDALFVLAGGPGQSAAAGLPGRSPTASRT